jgi:hypothetical protein
MYLMRHPVGTGCIEYQKEKKKNPGTGFCRVNGVWIDTNDRQKVSQRFFILLGNNEPLFNICCRKENECYIPPRLT